MRQLSRSQAGSNFGAVKLNQRNGEAIQQRHCVPAIETLTSWKYQRPSWTKLSSETCIVSPKSAVQVESDQKLHNTQRGEGKQRGDHTQGEGFCAGAGLPWCVEAAWHKLRPAGAFGCSAPCRWWRCACQTKLSAVLCAPRRGWQAAVCRKAARRRCGSPAAVAALPVPCLKGLTAASTRPDVARASAASRRVAWRDRCTHWCTARGCAPMRERWRRTQVRASAQTLCVNWWWIHFFTLGTSSSFKSLSVTTKLTALTHLHHISANVDVRMLSHITTATAGTGSLQTWLWRRCVSLAWWTHGWAHQNIFCLRSLGLTWAGQGQSWGGCVTMCCLFTLISAKPRTRACTHTSSSRMAWWEIAHSPSAVLRPLAVKGALL